MGWFNDQEILDRLARIERKLDNLIRAYHRRSEMAQADIDRLKASVEKNTSATNSAVMLIQGLAQQIRDASDDPAELQALADRLTADADALGAAVTANTPSAPTAPTP